MFGEDEPTGTYELNLRFPGQYFDKESGFSYNINRYYNPTLGRYMQSDPIGLCGGTNTFSYSQNNPIINDDKYGLLSCKACLKGCEFDIEALCRKMKNVRARAACWATVYVGETACKGVCYLFFCD